MDYEFKVLLWTQKNCSHVFIGTMQKNNNESLLEHENLSTKQEHFEDAGHKDRDTTFKRLRYLFKRSHERNDHKRKQTSSSQYELCKFKQTMPLQFW